MAQKNETPILVAALVLTLALLGLGGWWVVSRLGLNVGSNDSGSPLSPDAESPAVNPPSTTSLTPPAGAPPTTPPPDRPSTELPAAPIAQAPAFPLLAMVPAGTTVRLGGSTSMVQINQRLKQGFEQRYLGSTVMALANGTDLGLQGLQQGTLDVAGISRSLTPKETQAGLQAVAIARDAIALVIGLQNPYTGSLTQQQVVDIFQGRVTNWSQVGGPDAPMRVINRPPISGTHQAFQELVLAGGDFGTGPTITTLERDATTPMLRSLGKDGIGYATYTQVATQQTVRVVPIEGRSPQDRNYAFQRVLAYAYQNPANAAAEAFLGYTLSDAGQAAITSEP